jgi:hypothetical protein
MYGFEATGRCIVNLNMGSRRRAPPHRKEMPMPTSIYTDLCTVADALAAYARDLPAGPQRDRLEDLVRQLDAVIDRPVGVTEAFQPHEEEQRPASQRTVMEGITSFSMIVSRAGCL